MTEALPSIEIVSVGVVGLTSAFLLAHSGYGVSIVARDLPEDMANS